jgi:hypothetical protein
MPDWVPVVIAIVNQVGVPTVLLLWGPWFVTVHAFPAFKEIALAYARAMSAIAAALDKIADRFPDPPTAVGDRSGGT